MATVMMQAHGTETMIAKDGDKYSADFRYKNVDYGQEEQKRQKVREPYTREELEAVYDRKIKAEVRHWGECSFWANTAREVKAKRLEEFDAGKVVEVYSSEYHADGMDWADNYYSDGTTDKSCYGYSD